VDSGTQTPLRIWFTTPWTTYPQAVKMYPTIYTLTVKT
jgi:hypothetical protein